ncbi:MAG: HipA domain-containing protein [Atopobiaceae bacterium]|nr:HipA domain-containing protein [Atopobiaceae bacterium]
MSGSHVRVWVDRYGSYELAGTIEARDVGLSFAYDPSFRGPAISAGMPLQVKPFSSHRTETFFHALAPEGDTQLDFLRLMRANRSEWLPFLQRLGDESSGALVFSLEDDAPGMCEGYDPVGEDYVETLAREPALTTMETLSSTRVSVAGAMRKVGLYRQEKSQPWHRTRGAAPTTHILKVPNEHLFPLETINEAICLTVARLCDIETEEFELVPTETATILAARRFDRPLPEDPILVSGLARPKRVHQEDLCQLGDTPVKYEPSGAHYLSFASRLVRGACANAFGEAMGLLCHVYIDYLLGNCDNHLKNFSVLYDETMRTAQLSPAYDILDTTIYARVASEMGVPLSFNRSIVGVSYEDLVEAIRHAGFPEKLALGEFESVRDDVLRHFPEACDIVASQGFAKEVERLATPMSQGLKARAGFSFTERDRQYLDTRGLGTDRRK